MLDTLLVALSRRQWKLRCLLKKQHCRVDVATGAFVFFGYVLAFLNFVQKDIEPWVLAEPYSALLFNQISKLIFSAISDYVLGKSRAMAIALFDNALMLEVITSTPTRITPYMMERAFGMFVFPRYICWQDRKRPPGAFVLSFPSVEASNCGFVESSNCGSPPLFSFFFFPFRLSPALFDE